MSKILSPGFFAIVAKLNMALTDSPFTSENCSIIYKADQNYQHWQPGGELNAFDELEKGVGYIAVIKQTVDVSEAFAATEDIGGMPNPGQYISNDRGTGITVKFYNQSEVEIGSPVVIASHTVKFIPNTDMPTGTAIIKVTGTGSGSFVVSNIGNDGVVGEPSYVNVTDFSSTSDNKLRFTVFPQYNIGNTFNFFAEAISKKVFFVNKTASDITVKYRNSSHAILGTLILNANTTQAINKADMPTATAEFSFIAGDGTVSIPSTLRQIKDTGSGLIYSVTTGVDVGIEVQYVLAALSLADQVIIYEAN